MNILKKLKEAQKLKFTFMIIPHNGKKVKQVKINKLVVATTLSMVIFTSIFFVGSTTILYKENLFLNHDLIVENDKVNSLNIITKQQQTEIDNLKDTSKFVIDKLSQLYALENQVRDMVGLESSNEDENDILLASRSLDNRSSTFLQDDIGPLDIEDLTDSESVNTISNLIESEKGKFDQLITDVEKQLKFLESKPDKWPVSGNITSGFGYRIHPISRKRDFHQGIDIANKTGTIIVASGSGIVTFSGYNGGYGRVIIISHGYGYRSVYAHNQENFVKVGDRIEKGESIAKLGNTGSSTGPHVHFEIHYNGNQVNPLKILKKD